MQIPIISGIFADASPEFRTSYPVNLVPIPKEQGISSGYLKPADGIVQDGEGPSLGRGGIEWNGACYRVMGTSFVRVSEDGSIVTLGDVGPGGPVTMTYSFDLLAIASGGRLFYWDGGNLTQVTDPDLGEVLDVIWVDGYFMTTDGENLVVTELNDPTAVDPLKYGSSEVDPDPIKAVLKLRNEVYAVNRYTVEVFSNVGGSGFPFQRISGAQVTRGAVGTHAATVFQESIAFVGGGKHESIGVFAGVGGASAKISTREIDEILSGLSTSEQESLVIEVRRDKSNDTLIIHTPNGALCYDAGATQAIGQPVWYKMNSGANTDDEYRGKFLVWCYNKWLVSDTQSGRVGHLDRAVQSHWGSVVSWEFGTPVIYSGARGGIIHSLEIVGLTGSGELGNTAKISAEYSSDGAVWSQPKYINAGAQGDRNRRIKWTKQGAFRQRRMYRFRGDSTGPIAPATIEAEIEALAW